jgi:alkanesulfonate monooxygenase SsuD/methylene tetrahydromethanopterin reductase-like flavin-dependent oxidoreductase (luciferase family)
MQAMKDFSWGAQPITYDLTWPESLEAAMAVERLGYDQLWVGDHLYSTGGDPHQPFFEGWTMLGAFATLTSRARIGMLVAANPLRNPAWLAKMATTLDHISNGRFILGIGAGNRELEASAHGMDPGRSVGERLDWLDESLTIVRAILNGQTVTHDGPRYHMDQVRHAPRPVQSRIPIVMGAEGERKSLRIVARHADLWQIWLSPTSLEDWQRKDRVLQGHCADLGRDHTTIQRIIGGKVVIRPSQEAADAAWREEVRLHQWPESMTSFSWIGTPERIAEQIVAFRRAGAQGFTASVAAPLDLETIELLANEVRPMVEAANA